LSSLLTGGRLCLTGSALSASGETAVRFGSFFVGVAGFDAGLRAGEEWVFGDMMFSRMTLYLP
jgi:hypothetical protein